MANNADEKRIKILEAAKRRFAHYGMAKTTMAEIAKDLSFSKALLYYYFPDKNRLYAAVLEHVIQEANLKTEQKVKLAKNVEDAINVILNVSLEFKKKYYYILEYTISIRKELPIELDAFLEESFKSQVKLIARIFEKGIADGELKAIVDLEDTARVLLYAIVGMRMSVVKDFRSDFIPDKSEFDDILLMQQKLAKIFLNGLRA